MAGSWPAATAIAATGRPLRQRPPMFCAFNPRKRNQAHAVQQSPLMFQAEPRATKTEHRTAGSNLFQSHLGRRHATLVEHQVINQQKPLARVLRVNGARDGQWRDLAANAV